MEHCTYIQGQGQRQNQSPDSQCLVWLLVWPHVWLLFPAPSTPHFCKLLRAQSRCHMFSSPLHLLKEPIGSTSYPSVKSLLPFMTFGSYELFWILTGSTSDFQICKHSKHPITYFCPMEAHVLHVTLPIPKTHRGQGHLHT